MDTQRKVKVFLVDDDPYFLQMLMDNLSEDILYDVKSFATGEDCLREMLGDKPDLVVLDYHLDNVNKKAANGIEILKQIRMINEDIPVVILSGSLYMEVPFESYGHGAYCFIEKNDAAFRNVNRVLMEVAA